MDLYSKLSDVELSGLLKSGNHAAFTELYNRYWHVLYIHALKMLHNEDEATDIVQDIYTQLWKRAEELELHTGIKAYLYTSVRNQTLKVINRSKVRDKFIHSIAFNYQEGMNVTDDELAYKTFSELIEKEISNLPPRMREVFLKSREEGLSYKNIAQELNITENTVKKTIYRTLLVLRSKLNLWPAIFILLWKK